MKYLTLVTAFVLVSACDTANNIPNPVDSYFVRYYGADGDQEGVDMIVNSDGTYMLLGTSSFNNANYRVYLTKVDERGEVIWEQFYDATKDERAIDIEPISNGNFVILANADSTSTGVDIKIFTVDANGSATGDEGYFTYPVGNGIRSSEIGVTVTPIESAGSPAGFIVSGNTDYDANPGDNGANGFEGITALFVRFEANCDLYQGVWTAYRSSSGADYCTKAIQIADLNAAYPFQFFGYTSSDPTNTSLNFWSTTANNFGGGLLLENGVIEGSPTTDEILGSVTIAKPVSLLSNFLMSGISTNGPGASNIFITTTNPSILQPTPISEIELGDILSSNLRSSLIKVTACPSSSGYLIAANAIQNGKSNIVLIKVSADGQLIWPNPVIIGGEGDDLESAVYELNDGRILVFGTMSIGDDEQKKMTLLKMNKDGQFQ